MTSLWFKCSSDDELWIELKLLWQQQKFDHQMLIHYFAHYKFLFMTTVHALQTYDQLTIWMLIWWWVLSWAWVSTTAAKIWSSNAHSLFCSLQFSIHNHRICFTETWYTWDFNVIMLHYSECNWEFDNDAKQLHYSVYLYAWNFHAHWVFTHFN